MSGRSHRKQWRQLSVIEANDNELPAKPMQRTGEPEAPARASVPERFRRLKRNEVVWSGDFVADERLWFELWEAPGVSRAGSFARPIYLKEETEKFRPTRPDQCLAPPLPLCPSTPTPTAPTPTS